jgi:hypothetical protein
MGRRSLAEVTLCAVDARSPGLAWQALQRSMAGIDFARAVLFTDDWSPHDRSPAIEVVDVGPIRSGAEYSHFVLRRLASLVDTPYVLVTQWDGFVVDPAAWSDEFLAFDYIGAPWHDQPPALCVGNGGFSLRSRRLLLAAQDPRIVDEHPEDEMLCRRYRALLEQEHGIRFAPPALARRFAFENEAPAGPTLGFHGPYNLPRFLDAATLGRWLDELPDPFFRSRDARRLARSLLKHRMPDLARRVVGERMRVGRREPGTRMIGVAAGVLARLEGRRRP